MNRDMFRFSAISHSIATKTVALVLVIVCLLVAALILTSRHLVLSRFSTLEREEGTVQVRRVVNEINSTLEKMNAFVTDWAFWDDTFQFVEDGNSDYIDSNLMDETFTDQRLNLMVFFDRNGNLLHHKFFDLAGSQAIAPDAVATDAFTSLIQPFLRNPDSAETQTGTVITPAGPLLLAISPVLPSLRNAPSRGWLVIGRYLDAAEVARIGQLTELNLSIAPAAVESGEASGWTATFATALVDDRTMIASTRLTDMTGQPSLSVQVRLPRTIYLQGYAMWKQHAVSAVLLGFAFVVILTLLLNRIVLRKLVGLAGEVDQIAESTNPEKRLSARGADEIGHLTGRINAMLDQLQALERAQEEQKRYLQQLLDTINCGVMVIDATENRILSINRIGAALLDRDPLDVIGLVRHELISPREPDDNAELDRHGQVILGEGTVLRQDRSELPVLRSVAAIEHDGRALLIESFVDISLLKRAEAELRASEARYRRFFDEDLTGDFIVTVDGEILDCNLAYARLFGYETVEEIKRTNVVSQYIEPAGRDRFLERIRREGRLERYESELRRRDGSPIFCIGNEIGEFDDQGELVRIRGYLFDDTKRVLLERDIRQNQKLEAIGTLAGGIAHDFNNILAGIIGYAEIILVKESANSQMHDYLRKILAAGEKARELIYQILAFSRKTESTLQPVQIRPVVSEALQLVRATLPSTIAIEERMVSAATVMADPVQLHQVVLNLCTNAGHAMREHGGTLTVSLEQAVLTEEDRLRHPQLKPGDCVCLRVSDTGHGIPIAILNRIFDPFFTTKSKDEGTGLGLSVVHGIVRSLQGAITVDSTPGKGTTFEVFLPLVDVTADTAHLAAAPAPTSGPATGQEHILYVDDDPFLVEIGKEILLSLGYRVTAFADSVAALDYLIAHPGEVDLVVSDLTMPRLTGIDLARSLRTAGRTVPILLYTGYDEELVGEDLAALGICKVLLKPLKPLVLSSEVRHILDARGISSGAA